MMKADYTNQLVAQELFEYLKNKQEYSTNMNIACGTLLEYLEKYASFYISPTSSYILQEALNPDSFYNLINNQYRDMLFELIKYIFAWFGMSVIIYPACGHYHFNTLDEVEIINLRLNVNQEKDFIFTFYTK